MKGLKQNFLRPPVTSGEYAADALRVIGLLSVVAAAIWWEPTDAGILALALPALLVPRFVGVRSSFDIVYCLTVLVAAWSNVLDLYRTVAAWDLLLHVVCTGVIAAMLYLVFSRFGIVPAPGSASFRPRMAIAIVPALGLAVSALWEMIEWLGYTFVSNEIFVAYGDTIADMAVGGLGAVAAGTVVAFVRLERATTESPALSGRASPVRPAR